MIFSFTALYFVYCVLKCRCHRNARGFSISLSLFLSTLLYLSLHHCDVISRRRRYSRCLITVNCHRETCFMFPENFNKNMTKFTENFPSVILQPTFIIYISHESRWIYPHFANKYHIQYFENPTTNNASSPSSRKFQTRSWHCKFFFILFCYLQATTRKKWKIFFSHDDWRQAAASSWLGNQHQQQ